MTAEELDQPAPKRKAIPTLKAVTDEATRLIGRNIRERWHFVALSANRGYALAPVPFTKAVDEDAFGHPLTFWRLISRDFGASPAYLRPPRPPRRFNVIDGSVPKGSKFQFRLCTGRMVGEDVFRNASDIDRMRFWRDYYHGLEASVTRPMGEAFSELESVAERATAGIAYGLRRRRGDLSLSKEEFAEMLGITTEEVTDMEHSDMVMTPRWADTVLNAFEKLEEMVRSRRIYELAEDYGYQLVPVHGVAGKEGTLNLAEPVRTAPVEDADGADLMWGAELRALRHGRDLTQEKLGVLAGLADSIISRAESGERRVTPYVQERIVAAIEGYGGEANVDIESLPKSGAEVRAGRLKRGLSQEDLAALTGLERHHISLVERGKRVLTRDTQKRILAAFGMYDRDSASVERRISAYMRERDTLAVETSGWEGDESLPKSGAEIRAARTQRGLTQKDLSALSGLTRYHVGLVERGKRGLTPRTQKRTQAAIQLYDRGAELAGGLDAGRLHANGAARRGAPQSPVLA